MHGLDVLRMVISPGSSHSFRVSVVRYDFAAVVKFMVANGALSCLIHDFSVQQLSHVCRLPDYAEWLLRIAVGRRARCVLSRHNQRLSRKARSWSSGLYRTSLMPRGSVRDRAFSFTRISAWRYIWVLSADS